VDAQPAPEPPHLLRGCKKFEEEEYLFIGMDTVTITIVAVSMLGICQCWCCCSTQYSLAILHDRLKYLEKRPNGYSHVNPIHVDEDPSV